MQRLVSIVTIAEIEALVAHVADLSRHEPVVIVTTKSGATTPLVDATALAEEIAPVPVYLIATGPLTWEMTALLPEGMSVFGGASRIYWPGWREDDALQRHQLLFTWGADKAEDTLDRLLTLLDGRRMVSIQPPAPTPSIPSDLPALDAIVMAEVVDAMPGGAEVKLHNGLVGWYRLPRKATPVQPGDRIEVRFGGVDNDGRAILATPPRQRDIAASPAAPPKSGLPKPGPSKPPSSSTPSPEDQPDPDDRDNLIVELQTALALARRESMQLQAQLAELEERVADGQRELRSAVQEAKRQVQDLKRDQKSMRDRNAHLEQQLHGTGRHQDPEQQFRHEVQLAWARTYLGADQDQWPLHEFTLGPEFLAELDGLEGVERSKVVEVAADVITGRAFIMPAREHHALRTGEGGDDRQRRRFSDGAVAYRVSLQVKTPSARRLHYWLLPDGSVELANVGVHDRLVIS